MLERESASPLNPPLNHLLIPTTHQGGAREKDHMFLCAKEAKTRGMKLLKADVCVIMLHMYKLTPVKSPSKISLIPLELLCLMRASAATATYQDTEEV